MVNVRATEIALAYGLFPDGWWTSLYGHPYHYQKKWNWRRLRKTLKQTKQPERKELSHRIRVPIRFDTDRIMIIPDRQSLTFEHLPAGYYDMIAVHESATGQLIDMTPLGPSVTLAGNNGTIVAPLPNTQP